MLKSSFTSHFGVSFILHPSSPTLIPYVVQMTHTEINNTMKTSPLLLCLLFSWLWERISYIVSLEPASWLSSKIKAVLLLPGIIGLHGNIQFLIIKSMWGNIKLRWHSSHGIIKLPKRPFFLPLVDLFFHSFLSDFPLKCHSGPIKPSHKPSGILTPRGKSIVC